MITRFLIPPIEHKIDILDFVNWKTVTRKSLIRVVYWSLRVTVSILSGRFGALIVVVEAWNFFYILIKVSWVPKSINGKKFLEGKNRDFGTFFEILNFTFCTKSGSRDCQWASINISNESPWSTEHFCISEKFKKNIFNPFRRIFSV